MGYAAGAAARTDFSALAGQRKSTLGAALGAPEADEAAFLREAAPEVAVEGGGHELRDGASGGFEQLDVAGPGRFHQRMKGTVARIWWDVGGTCDGHRSAGRERRALREVLCVWTVTSANVRLSNFVRRPPGRGRALCTVLTMGRIDRSASVRSSVHICHRRRPFRATTEYLPSAYVEPREYF